MRPLAIDVKGFTCFRDPQPTLHLAPLSLFAIAGPTGAGKSSILDAITFALYGKVPRMGHGSVKDLISHGSDRMTVTLRFAVRDRAFVVTRTVRRGTAAGACQLDEAFDGGATMMLASGAREVSDAVERLVGLDYDAFTHAVILPQGEFARFLKGDPGTRRRILQELLRLTVYARMQKLASERSRDAKSLVGALEQHLERYADATPDAVARAEEELASVQSAQPALIAARDEARARRAAHEARAKVARELAARRAELEVLRQGEADQETRLVRIARARRARQMSTAIAQLARDQQVYDSRAQDHAAASSRLGAACASATTARARLTEAEAACATADAHTARIEALRAVEGRLAHRDAVRVECREIDRRLASVTADADSRAADVRAREREFAAAMEDVARLKAAVASVQFDPGELLACEDGRDLARELAADRAGAPDAAVKVRDASSALTEANRIAEAEAARLDQTRDALARAEARRADAVCALTLAQDAHRAMTLRSHLAPGHTCPVCEQHVPEVPPIALAPELAALLTAQDEAADACRTIEARVAAHLETHTRASAAAEGARSHLAAAELSRETLLTRITASITRLVQALGPYLPASAAAMPDHWLLERLDALRDLQMQRETRERRLQIAYATRVDAEHRVALAQQVLDGCRREAALAVAQLAAKQAEREALDDEIRAVSTAADPRAELEGLVRQVREAQGALDAARVDVMRQDTQEAAAVEAEAVASRLLQEARTALETLAGTLEQALASCGFTSADEAREALLDDGALGELESRAESHVRQVTATEALVANLETQAGSGEVTDADLAACVEAEQRAEQAVSDAVRLGGQLEVRLAGLREHRLHASGLASQVDAARRTLIIHQRLTTDLQANAFQAWLLREAFERIVAGASERLMELSGRYTFQWHDDEFAVVDHDNAQERRAADTLSGGETFLASLALALELSEQVQRAAGAVRLDSLFIDEGFGSLDAVALETVASAIESLQLSGRMVGIITHIRELTDRMPDCIVIEKGPDGSRWSIR